jgi:predicted ATPase
VDAELLYQSGLPPQATYVFKHALIREAAYHSLLKSTRQRYHEQIARKVAERFPETVETQPELIAHHYTEAGLTHEALVHWQLAGVRAAQRSAHVEAVSHFRQGLALLETLPDTPERGLQELTVQVALGSSLTVLNSHAVPEVERAYARARELCQQVGETPQLFPVLFGLRAFDLVRGDLQAAQEFAEQCLTLAQRVQDPALLLLGHMGLGHALLNLGEFVLARTHLEAAMARYDSQQHSSLLLGTPQDPGVSSLCYLAWCLWLLGYPDQALQKSNEAMALAREQLHPFSLANALFFTAIVRRCRREEQGIQELAEALIALSTQHEFAFALAAGTFFRGWALARQGRGEEGIAQMHRSITTTRATRARLGQPGLLGLLAEAYAAEGQVKEGLALLTEALDAIHRNGERLHEAELYRLRGELTLRSRQVEDRPETNLEQVESKAVVPGPQPPTSSPQAEVEAEACFHRAIAIARRQSARSLELRAVMSLSRLWQTQGKQDAARQLLAAVYGWFTEGFDTPDLKDARTLLQDLDVAKPSYTDSST